MTEFSRKTVDVVAYAASRKNAPCFVCAIIAGDPGHDHEIFYDDGDTFAFLNRYPTLLGYSLVCLKRHVEDLCEDLSPDEYLATQAVVHKVARALKRVVPTERVYVMSLGSMSGNRHIHWHVAPLPPGVPYEQQQFHALMMETNGVLDMDAASRADLAERLRAELA